MSTLHRHTPTTAPEPAMTTTATTTTDHDADVVRWCQAPPHEVSSGNDVLGTPWRRASSRAVHPSAHAGDEPLVAVIAAGLAAVSVPWELTTDTAPIERCYELLLSAEQY